MKKVIIGSILMLSGLITTLSLIIVAALHVQSVTRWRGSKLWFIIFGASDLKTGQELYLGFPFVVGLILLILGFFILAVEYFKKDKC